MNLNKPKDSASIQETLRQGVTADFWKLILQAIDESIEVVRNEQNDPELKDLPADQYKLESEIMKARIADLNHLRAMPENIISWLEDPNVEGKPENFDPYHTSKDFEK